ncbi:hypothetical protein BH11BAC2_BH11BAC2_16480 [soil metagenome]
MQNQELNSKIDQRLQEFDAMEGIAPSADWNSSLMSRLEKSKPNSTRSFVKESYKLVILLLLVINIGFVVNVIQNSKSVDSISRNTELQKVSSELLINAIISNN